MKSSDNIITKKKKEEDKMMNLKVPFDDTEDKKDAELPVKHSVNNSLNYSVTEFSIASFDGDQNTQAS